MGDYAETAAHTAMPTAQAGDVRSTHARTTATSGVQSRAASEAHILSGPDSGLGRRLRILAAARVHKVLPLVALVAIAALSHGSAQPLALAAASGYVLIVVVIGMHLNAITDRAVDRVRKPHLAEWTTSDQRTLRGILTAETLACVVLLMIAAAAAPSAQIVVWMGLLAILSTTYSFNIFIPSRGASLRGKVHWLSHALTISGSYFCLWMIGFSSATPPHQDVAGSFVVLALALAVVDYGAFIQESANDWVEERAAGFRTLPALWGHHRTSALGLTLVIGGALLAWHEIGRSAGLTTTDALFCLLGLQILGTFASTVTSHRSTVGAPGERYSTERLMDFVFWGARIVPLALLLIS